MKKFKKIIVVLGIFSFFFTFGMCINTYAAEPEENQDETTEVVDTEEKVTVEMKLVEFQNKWLTPIVSGALGLLGSFIGYFLYKRKYKTIMALLSSGIKLTEQQRKEANEDLIKTKELYETAKADFEQKRKDYENIITLAKDEIKELRATRIENEQFKELVGLLVASSPELMKNGYGEKILKLLDESKVVFDEGKKIYEIITEDVGDDNGTNN